MTHGTPLPRHSAERPRVSLAHALAERAVVAALSWLIHRQIAALIARLEALFAAWRAGTLVLPAPGALSRRAQNPHRRVASPSRTSTPVPLCARGPTARATCAPQPGARVATSVALVPTRVTALDRNHRGTSLAPMPALLQRPPGRAVCLRRAGPSRPPPGAASRAPHQPTPYLLLYRIK